MSEADLKNSKDAIDKLKASLFNCVIPTAIASLQEANSTIKKHQAELTELRRNLHSSGAQNPGSLQDLSQDFWKCKIAATSLRDKSYHGASLASDTPNFKQLKADLQTMIGDLEATLDELNELEVALPTSSTT